MPNRSVDEQERIVRRPIDQLLLDPENPRIVVPEGAKQAQLIKTLYETEGLDDLALSFVRNGYFLEEPVVVVPVTPGKDTSFHVVEGNRRVATLKILLDPKLRKALAVDWPELDAGAQTQLSQVPTVRYEKREDVVPYLGFRHITGIRTWDPYAKARYVAQLIEAGRPVSDVEESVGDKARTVKRLYQSFVVMRQAGKELGVDTRPIIDTFSLLEVALAQSSIKKFVGLDGPLPSAQVEKLVPEENLEPLREVLSWVFGDKEKGQERLVTDSRQIPQRLAPIVSDPDSLKYLRDTRDLEGAYEFSGGEQKVLLRQLGALRRSTQRVLGLLPGHKEDKEVKSELASLRPLIDALRTAIAP